MFSLPLVVLLSGVMGASAAWATVVPRGGETYHAGDIVAIEWNASLFSGHVNIELWDGTASRFETIASRIDAKKGRFTWVVSPGLAGDRYRMRVTATESHFSMMSGTYFSIRGTPRQPGQQFAIIGADVEVTVHTIPTVRTTHLRVRWEPGEVAAVDAYGISGRHVFHNSDGLESTEEMIVPVGDLPRGVYIVVVRYQNGRIGSANVSVL